MNKKLKKLILAKSILGCISALPIFFITIGLEGLIFMGVLPMVLLITFGITKKFVFGIIYTVLFVLTRFSILLFGLPLAAALSWILLLFYIYVDIRVWNGKKEENLDGEQEF